MEESAGGGLAGWLAAGWELKEREREDKAIGREVCFCRLKKEKGSKGKSLLFFFSSRLENMGGWEDDTRERMYRC